MSIVNDIEDYIRKGESDSRDLGLEVEHFVIDSKGVQIGFHEVSSLIRQVAEELNAEIIYMDGYPVGYISEDHTITLEPSCQFEISINPFSDLDDIRAVYLKFRNIWDPIFESIGYHLETKGNLPLVEKGIIDPDDIPLSPKKRYKYMDAHFRKTGRYGKYMMRASASTQISVDFRSEADLVRKLSVLQKISPVLMIGMENKSYAGSELKYNPGKPHLFRIQEWDDLDDKRTGFFPGSFEPGFGYKTIAEVILNTPLILLTDNGETTDVGSKTASDLFRDDILDEVSLDGTRKTKLIEHFISMGFFHFRVKKYIEIRVADSVPIDRALGYAALIKGIVYSDGNLSVLEKELANVDTAEKIQNAVEQIKVSGANAPIYDGMTASEWGDHLVKLALDELNGKDREYLERVRAFWGVS